MTKPIIIIEYCPKCGWLLRASWMAQELLTTFSEELGGITLKPAEIAGVYKIYSNEKLLFDRKREGGFIEIKEIKQRIRDTFFPEKSLGHSDKNK